MFPGANFGGGILGARSPMPQPIQYPRPVSPVMPMPRPVMPTAPIGRAPISNDPRMPADPMRSIGTPGRPEGMFKKGGKVPKTASYFLHKGEHVLPKGKSKLTAKIRNTRPQKMMSVSALKGY
jgi:hypothetical protein